MVLTPTDLTTHSGTIEFSEPEGNLGAARLLQARLHQCAAGLRLGLVIGPKEVSIRVQPDDEPRPVRALREAIPKDTGRKAVLSAYISGPLKLRAKFKGRIVKARVRRDGTVRFAGEVYTSPSVAAAVACKRKSCNGWVFWHYERAPGDWVLLDALRR
jgi:hypothetical protein